MRCQNVRRRLVAGAAGDPRLARHLDGCAACRELAARLERARELLRSHHLEARPDAGFAARVTARITSEPDALGWAARRLLPVTLALTLVLGGLTLLELGRSEQQDPTEEIVAWILDSGEQVATGTAAQQEVP